MECEQLKKIVKEILQSYGFKKVKNSFYFNTKDFLIVIDLQKSMYDDYYYLNYGFCIESMNDYMPNPKTYQCEINMRGFQTSNEQIIIYKDVSENDFRNKFKKVIEDEINPIILTGKQFLSRQFKQKKWIMRIYGDEAYRYLMDN